MMISKILILVRVLNLKLQLLKKTKKLLFEQNQKMVTLKNLNNFFQKLMSL